MYAKNAVLYRNGGNFYNHYYSSDAYYQKLPKSWEITALNNIAKIINGDRGKNYPSKNKLHDTGDIPFISAVNLEDGTVSDKNLKYLDDDQYEKLNNGKLIFNDIAYCIRGSLGKSGRFPFEKGAIASSLVIIRSYDKSSVGQDFIHNYLNSSIAFNEIKKYDNGTAQPNLAAADLGKFKFNFPSLAEQKRISKSILQIDSAIQKIFQ